MNTVSPSLIVAACWFGGMALQAFMLLGFHVSRSDIKKLLWCLLGSLFAFMPGKKEREYNVYFHLLLSFCLFTLLFATTFKKRILRTITELDVMLWIILVTYAFAEHVHSLSLVPFIGFLFLLVIYFSIVSPYQLPSSYKVMLYLWYLGLVSAMGFLQFRYAVLTPFLHQESSILVSPAIAFFTGMAFLALGVHFWYIIELIPIPSKHQTFRSRMRNVRESIRVLSERTSAVQVRAKVGVFLLIALGIPLLINYNFQIVSSFTMINVAIISIPYLLQLSEYWFGNLFHSIPEETQA